MEQPAPGFTTLHLESVDSTNALALEQAGVQVPHRCWIVADQQHGGRGRHGRGWQSPPGNLYATLLLIDPCPVRDAPKLGFVAGLAVADAVASTAPGLDARLKWPNDLMARPGPDAPWSKLSGILLEGRFLEAGRQAVAIGIGVNIVHGPALPVRQATALAALGARMGRDALFYALGAAFAERLDQFARGKNFAAIRTAWLERAFPSGTGMSVKLPSGEKSGRFAGIDVDGRLALDTGAGLVHVDAGDVFLAPET